VSENGGMNPYLDLCVRIKELFPEEDRLIQWALAVDVMRPDESRYLAYRARAGAFGQKEPTAWAVLGMVESYGATIKNSIAQGTVQFP
jgi:hypothetical protein